ncbi:energy transducer TonB [Pseudomonas brassicacearum]|nr:energy transducer TonB [Pseudomonas brassicacearum]
MTGTVRVGFTAHTDSRVESVAMLHSDHPDFADAARNAVSQ